METKICKDCKKELPLSCFWKKLTRTTPFCKACAKARSKKYYQENQEKIKARCKIYREKNKARVSETNKRGYHRNMENPEFRERERWRSKLRKHGLTKKQYDTLYSQQNGNCAICGRNYKELFIDHCHETGKIRGLLCCKCNTGIGLLGDNMTGLLLAVDYLLKD